MRLSLRWKIAGLLLGVVLLEIAGFSVLLIMGVGPRTKRRLAEKAEAFARLLEPGVAASLEFMDPATAQRDLEALRGDRDFLYAVVLDGEGETFAQLGDTSAKGTRWEGPVIREGDTIGTIILHLNPGPTTREETSRVLSAGLPAAGLGLFLAFLALLYMGRLRAPVSLTARRLEEIAAGGADLTARVPVLSSDEVGRLAAAFNRFVESISQSVKDTLSAAKELSEVASRLGASSAAALERLEEYQKEVVESSQKAREQAASLRRLAENAFLMQDLSRQARAAASSTSDMAQEVRRLSEEGRKSSEEGYQSLDSVVMAIEHLVGVIENLRKERETLMGAAEALRGLAKRVRTLSINARIESSSGRVNPESFVVIATEVDRFSETIRGFTEVALSSIERLGSVMERITSSGEMAKEAVKSSAEASMNVLQSLARIHEKATAVTDSMDNLMEKAEKNMEATAQTASGVSTAEDAAQELSAAILGVMEQSASWQRLLEEVRKSSEDLRRRSKELRARFGAFRI
ncbi:MAG: HAMP domain-containing protein [candidate division WOR-3 bacterium]